MIAPELKYIAKQVDLSNVNYNQLCTAFGNACASRMETSLTDARIIYALQMGTRYLRDTSEDELQKAAADAAEYPLLKF